MMKKNKKKIEKKKKDKKILILGYLVVIILIVKIFMQSIILKKLIYIYKLFYIQNHNSNFEQLLQNFNSQLHIKILLSNGLQQLSQILK